MHGTTHRLMGICEVSPKLGSVRPPTVEAVSRKEVNDGKIGYQSSDARARQLELVTQPPPAAVIAKLTAIEGVRISPTVLGTQQGPDRHLGPEGAGAVLILQATFVDEQRAAAFFLKATELAERLSVAPGFIRRFTFADGPHHTLIALWRTPADAHAFFRQIQLPLACDLRNAADTSPTSLGSTER
jgi:hypothetical protein